MQFINLITNSLIDLSPTDYHIKTNPYLTKSIIRTSLLFFGVPEEAVHQETLEYHLSICE